MAEIDIKLMAVPTGAPDLTLLSAAERSRFGGMEPATAEAFAAGRSLLRRMLAARLGLSPETVELQQPGAGRVTLVSVGSGAPAFSVSHTRLGEQAWVAVAVSDGGPIGLDIEAPARPLDWRRTAARRYHPPEQERLLGLPEDEARAAFFDIWTQKEALVKLRDGKLLPILAAPFPATVWAETRRLPDIGLTASIVAEGSAARKVSWHLPGDRA